MTPLRKKARELLGRVNRIYDGEIPSSPPWSRSDLHALKSLGDAAGNDLLLKGRQTVDLLFRLDEQITAGKVERRFAAQVCRALDHLATAAEIRGL